MKRILYFTLTLGLCAGLAACSKPNKVLPKQDGLWEVTSASDRMYESNNLVLDTTFDAVFPEQYFFEDNGGGVFIDDTFTPEFEWTYDNKTKILTLSFSNPLLIWEFEVLKSKKNAQTWLIDYSIPKNSPDRVERTFELARVE